MASRLVSNTGKYAEEKKKPVMISKESVTTGAQNIRSFWQMGSIPLLMSKLGAPA